MKNLKSQLFVTLSCILFSLSPVFSQKNDVRFASATQYIQQHFLDWKLAAKDVSDFSVSSQYEDADSHILNIYLQQSHAGIGLHNAILNIHVLPNGKVFHAESRFLPNLAEKVNTMQANISAQQAIDKTLTHLGKIPPSSYTQLKNDTKNVFLFAKDNFSYQDVKVTLCYVQKDEKVLLAWDVSLDLVGANDYWNVRIDATSGQFIEKNSWTSHCKFNHGQFAHNADCGEKNVTKNSLSPKKINSLGSYNVLAFPAEAPSFAPRSILTDPADPVASPFGWHDTNGVNGAEYTITRGNNSYAYLDKNADNASDGGEPNGGTALNFNFPFDQAKEPDSSKAAATVNLFYVTNFMHDFAYKFGFTEAAGNFQTNNYGKGGAGNDHVLAEAQDGSGTDNANFSTPADGGNGRMQMYVWNRNNGTLCNLNQPTDTTAFETSSASGWASTSTVPTSGAAILVNDGTSSPTLGCNQPTNSVAGKIALIDRGSCQFGVKALNAQQKGAIGVVICNYEDAFVNMAAGTAGSGVTIPVVMLKKSACDLVKLKIQNTGVTLTLATPTAAGPSQLDGDFDNGIIAHEFGHGISNRLTGGPANASCLGNGEQMGEGWSDFFSLVTTVRAGDSGATPRGVGTYVFRQANNGRGIRNFPYTTDININPLTYDRMVNAQDQVHSVGEHWTVMLWDLYWKMTETYGLSADYSDATAGNYIAVKLVMQGMKLQPCSPGFVDGRNAILAADDALYNGVHKCLIWEVFARRGLGFSANQGSSGNSNDGKGAFDKSPSCVKEIKVTKKVTQLINAGDEIAVTINIKNDKDVVENNILAVDFIPNGTTYVAGSASNGGTASGSTVSFPSFDLNSGASATLTYKLKTPSDKKSIRQFYDDIEGVDSNWDLQAITGVNIWEVQDNFAKSGQKSWGIPFNDTMVNNQGLKMINAQLITGIQPIVRFYNSYDLESGVDGGIVETSEDGGLTWIDLSTKFFRNGYVGRIRTTTFFIPDLYAFWGNSNGFIGSYADLSSFIGKTLQFRFRYATNNAGSSNGWRIDDFELMDMINYQTEVCVTTSQSSQICAISDSKGTIVESELPNAANNLDKNVTKLSIYPNPNTEYINIELNNLNVFGNATINITNLEGKILYTEKVILDRNNLIPIMVNTLSAGTYFVQIQTEKQQITQKFVKL